MTLFVKLRWTTLATLVAICVAAIPLGWKFFLKPYQRQRIETFLSPETDPLGAGYFCRNGIRTLLFPSGRKSGDLSARFFSCSATFS